MPQLSEICLERTSNTISTTRKTSKTIHIVRFAWLINIICAESEDDDEDDDDEDNLRQDL
jgi:hypothetical protein